MLLHRHRRRRLHRLEPGQGAERARRDQHHRGRQPEEGRQVQESGRLRDRRLSGQGRLLGSCCKPVPSTACSRAVLHQGACSDTMETDGRYMMENNYRYSLALARIIARARKCRSCMPRPPRCTAAAACSARAANTNRRSTSMPIPSSCSTRWCAAAGNRTAQIVGLPLFQRVRPARAAQGSHGLGRLPLLQPVSRRRLREAVRRLRRLRQRRAAARFRLGGRRGQGQHVFPRPSGQVRHLQSRHRQAQSFNDVAVATINTLRAADGAESA